MNANASLLSGLPKNFALAKRQPVFALVQSKVSITDDPTGYINLARKTCSVPQSDEIINKICKLTTAKKSRLESQLPTVAQNFLAYRRQHPDYENIKNRFYADYNANSNIDPDVLKIFNENSDPQLRKPFTQMRMTGAGTLAGVVLGGILVGSIYGAGRGAFLSRGNLPAALMGAAVGALFLGSAAYFVWQRAHNAYNHQESEAGIQAGLSAAIDTFNARQDYRAGELINRVENLKNQDENLKQEMRDLENRVQKLGE
jgi:hypothetical protein